MEWVVLLNNQKVNWELVEDISTITQSTDYPYASVTTPAQCTITLIDETGTYSPENDDNFFTQQTDSDGNALNQDGSKCPVTIKIDHAVVFEGSIIEVYQDPNSANTFITCDDRTGDPIEDFGLEKDWKLILDTTQTGVNGIYPLTCGVTPISDESAEINKALNTPVNIVDKINTAGNLSSDNVKIEDDQVVSEGGPIDSVAGGAYPQMSAKSPYRYKTVIELVKLLTASVTNRTIIIDPVILNKHIESLGRIGYETIIGKLGSSTHLGWFGYVTDFIVDGTKIYFAYTCNRSNSHNSYIIQLDTIDDARTIKATLPANRQVWGLAKIGNNLIMLVSDPGNQTGRPIPVPTEGSYDSAVETSLVQLQYFDVTQQSPSIGTLVARSNTYRPQLAHFYQFGSKFPFTRRDWLQDALPDTRRRLIVQGTQLIYPYANEVNEVKSAGIAKVSIGGSPSKIMEFKSDGYNHAGYAYAMDGGEVFFATTFLTGIPGVWKTVKGTVS